jgi:hypothetical protein
MALVWVRVGIACHGLVLATRIGIHLDDTRAHRLALADDLGERREPANERRHLLGVRQLTRCLGLMVGLHRASHLIVIRRALDRRGGELGELLLNRCLGLRLRRLRRPLQLGRLRGRRLLLRDCR